MADKDWDRLTVFNNLDEQFDYETKHNLPHDERSYAKEFALMDTGEKVSRLETEHLELQEGLKKQRKDISNVRIALELSIDDELASLQEQIKDLKIEVFRLEEPLLSPHMTTDQRKEGLKPLREKLKPLIKKKEDILNEINYIKQFSKDILSTEREITETTCALKNPRYWMWQFRAAKDPLLGEVDEYKNKYIFADDFRPGGKLSEFPENRITELEDLNLETEPDANTVDQRASIYVELPPDNPASNIVISVNEPHSSPTDVEAPEAGLGLGYQKQVASGRKMRKERTDMVVKAPKSFHNLLSEKQRGMLIGMVGAIIGFGVMSILPVIWRKFKYRTQRSGRRSKSVEGKESWGEKRSKNKWQEKDAHRHPREWVRVNHN